MESETQLRDFLEQMAALKRSLHVPESFHYSSAEELLLSEGRMWRGRDLPAGIPRGLPRNCFLNCLELARLRPELTYVEGYATSVIPVHHAWLIDAAGEVVEPTWPADRRYPLSQSAYFGIPFPLELVEAQMHERRNFLSVLDNFEDGHPLLCQPLAQSLAPYRLPEPLPPRCQTRAHRRTAAAPHPIGARR
jgi:hypothetical protein